jgi:polyphosphate kinase
MSPKPISADKPEAYLNRELSWLSFASRVLAQAEDSDLPLLERIRFLGIVGMLHDEFFMKRISGLKRQIARGVSKISTDGRTPQDEFDACHEVLALQHRRAEELLSNDLRPALGAQELPIVDYEDLTGDQRESLGRYFRRSVKPILTPLAVDPEHPFPFVSNLGLNLAVILPHRKGEERLVRVKVPGNRPRWVVVPGGRGFLPLEQLIAAHLEEIHPGEEATRVHLFRVTRGAEGEPDSPDAANGDDPLLEPGSIIQQVGSELKARRFAGAVRLEIDAKMPKKFRKWLARQIGVNAEDVYSYDGLMGIKDLAALDPDRPDLRWPPHEPVPHPRLRGLDPGNPHAIFDEIGRGDILLHHPYDGFDSSVLRFIESAAVDPAVLAIKLTIYRTNRGSPIVQALAEAARRGKQVAVLVEVTARFDEAPNIAWGQFLEKEGVHVAYGVEQLKTHVKLALVVREEGSQVRLYAHFGTGNYHSGTARLYEDLGVLTCHPELCDEVAGVFNALTGATPFDGDGLFLVAPVSMRRRFTEMIRREAQHAEAGRPAGIDAKMNQLQDAGIIRELYAASQAGVAIRLHVRGLSCLRPGVPGLSDNIRLFGLVGRFLEHSRVYRFVNGGSPEYYIGSADWMKRNLDRRVETVVPLLDERVRSEVDVILRIYETDNVSAWDCDAEGIYHRRRPATGEERRAAQETLARRATVDARAPATAKTTDAP